MKCQPNKSLLSSRTEPDTNEASAEANDYSFLIHYNTVEGSAFKWFRMCQKAQNVMHDTVTFKKKAVRQRHLREQRGLHAWYKRNYKYWQGMEQADLSVCHA